MIEKNIHKNIHYGYNKKRGNNLNVASITLKEREYNLLGTKDIILKYENGVIKVRPGKSLTENEIKDHEGKIISLVKNQVIKFNKTSKVLSIPLGIIRTLNIPKKIYLKEKTNGFNLLVKKESEIKQMGKVITIKINKGGTGKSFLTTQLASGLALLGEKVLILTSDSQNNILDYTFNERKKPIFKNGLKAIVNGRDGEVIEIRKNLFYIPLESPKFGTTFGEKFKKFIDKNKKEYNYIIIDSTPTEKLDKVFVSCSDEIIVPAGANRVSINGTLNVINEIQSIKDRDIKINSIVINMFEKTKEQERVYNELKVVLENTNILFPKPIKKLSAIETLLSKGKTIWETNSKALVDVQETLTEMIKKLKQ